MHLTTSLKTDVVFQCHASYNSISKLRCFKLNDKQKSSLFLLDCDTIEVERLFLCEGGDIVSYYPKKGRVIFHVDMNSFYASVEMAYNPSLKGKPLAIAGNPEERRGIIVTSSYEARAKGVKTTMPLFQAKKLCPDLLVLKPNFDRYREASKAMFKIMADITDKVEPVSIDEGYLDITDCEAQGNPLEIAQNLQQRLLDELDLPCSIGIAPNKFLAKMASDMKKPLGITVLRKRELAEVLWPLDVGEMHGIGAKTKEKLNQIDIYTIGDLARADEMVLKRVLGINGVRLIKRANGEDHRPVDPDSVFDFKSVGNSETLRQDTTDETILLSLLRKLSNKVSTRLKRKAYIGETVQLMIRYYDRKTITRSVTVHRPIEQAEAIYGLATQLFETHWNGDAIRLLGVTVQGLVEKKYYVEQLDIFHYQDHLKNEQLASTIQQLTDKYGYNPFERVSDKKTPTSKSNESASDQPTTSFQKDFLDDFRQDK